MQLYEIGVCQAKIVRFHTAYNKHEMIKIEMPFKPEKNRKYYLRGSNNLAADCRSKFQNSAFYRITCIRVP